MDYNKIHDKLYVGSYPETGQDIGTLKHELSVTAVLSLQTDEDFDYLDIHWNKLESDYRAAGITVHRVPVPDLDHDDLHRKLSECVRGLTNLLEDDHTVYLHCTAGTGRSPSVAIAYLRWSLGMDLDEAENHVRSRRICSPDLAAIRQATETRRGGHGRSP